MFDQHANHSSSVSISGKRNEEAMMWEEFCDGIRDTDGDKAVENALIKAGFKTVFEYGHAKQYRKENIMVVVSYDEGMSNKPQAFFVPIEKKARQPRKGDEK